MYNWFIEYGYSGIVYVLCEYYDLMFKQFFVNVVGFEDEDFDEWEWKVDYEVMVNVFDVYFMLIEICGG